MVRVNSAQFFTALLLLSIFMILWSNNFISYESEDIHIYPAPDLKNLTFGHDNTMADIFWLKFLQDSDYCENQAAEKSSNTASNLDQILTSKLKPSRCHKGWVYQVLNLITDLAPDFYDAYLIGATSLTVGVDDREGSRLIFEKGLREFPDDWVLNFRASYLYLYEIQDPHRAAQLLITAYRNGGPQFLPSLAARLYTRAGKAIIGKAILEDFIKEHPDSDVTEHAKERLKEIEKDLH